MSKGRILLLNGTSSAGKTSLAWELQTNAPSYWYWLALDSFLDAVPSQQWEKEEGAGLSIAFSLHNDVIKLVADQGRDVIVDTVFCNREVFEAFKERFQGYTVLMVKAGCPLEELNRREKARGDRDIGLAASQIPLLTPREDYDLIVDTHAETIAECGKRIMELLANPPAITVFETLCTQ